MSALALHLQDDIPGGNLQWLRDSSQWLPRGGQRSDAKGVL